MTLPKTNILRKLIRSRIAVALPVTFLILFVTTLGLVSATYYFAIQKIGSESQMVKIATAKQNFLALNDKILSIVWNPGSSSTINIADSGGSTRIQPVTNQLVISVNDSSRIQEVVYASPIGNVLYELPYSQTSQTGEYLQGDSRSIINQTGYSQSQLSIVEGAEHPEMHLSYRPIVSYSIAGLENGKTINDIRVYIVNLNSSTAIMTRGELPLIIKCLDAQIVTKSYEVNYQPFNLDITSTKEDSAGRVVVPVSSTSQGAIINLEIVVVNVAIERWIR